MERKYSFKSKTKSNETEIRAWKYLFIYKIERATKCLSFCYEDQLCIKFQNLAIITRPENFKHQFLSLFFSESKTIKSFHVKKNTTMQYPIKGHDLVIMGSCDYSNKPQEFISDPQIYFTCHLSQTANTEKKLNQIEWPQTCNFNAIFQKIDKKH